MSILQNIEKKVLDMFEISYIELLIFITFVWVLSRTIIGIKKHQLNWKYEVKLLTLYICLM